MLKAARADGPQDADLQQRVRSARHLIDRKVGEIGDPMQFGAGLEQRNGLGNAPRLGRHPLKARDGGLDDGSRRESIDG